MRFVKYLAIFVGLVGFSAVDMSERPLQPVNRPVIAGLKETRCPPYLVMTTFGGIAAPQIVFAFKDSGGNTKQDLVSKDRTIVYVSEDQAPTYEKTSVEGRDGAIFRLNPVEYEKAHACLPEPTKTPQ